MEGVLYCIDCVAANLVLQISKLRYIDGKMILKLHILFKSFKILIKNKKNIDILETILWHAEV